MQQTAEVLAVATLAQTIRPGAPIMYGSFASNVDMQSGAPALGTPEYTKAAQASGQIARRLGLPFRSSNTTVSNCVDAQAAFESQMSLWGSVMGHANLVNHAAGWLEGGLTASFEKLTVFADSVLGQGGLGRFDRGELEKALAGKVAAARLATSSLPAICRLHIPPRCRLHGVHPMH